MTTDWLYSKKYSATIKYKYTNKVPITGKKCTRPDSLLKYTHNHHITTIKKSLNHKIRSLRLAYDKINYLPQPTITKLSSYVHRCTENNDMPVAYTLDCVSHIYRQELQEVQETVNLIIQLHNRCWKRIKRAQWQQSTLVTQEVHNSYSYTWRRSHQGDIGHRYILLTYTITIYVYTNVQNKYAKAINIPSLFVSISTTGNISQIIAGIVKAVQCTANFLMPKILAKFKWGHLQQRQQTGAAG